MHILQINRKNPLNFGIPKSSSTLPLRIRRDFQQYLTPLKILSQEERNAMVLEEMERIRDVLRSGSPYHSEGVVGYKQEIFDKDEAFSENIFAIKAPSTNLKPHHQPSLSSSSGNESFYKVPLTSNVSQVFLRKKQTCEQSSLDLQKVEKRMNKKRKMYQTQCCIPSDMDVEEETLEKCCKSEIEETKLKSRRIMKT